MRILLVPGCYLRAYHQIVLPFTETEEVNEFCRLYFKKHLFTNGEQNQLDALGEIIQSRYSNLAADQTEIAKGTGCEVRIGQKSLVKSWLSMHAVYKAAGGLKPFLLLCTVTFKALAAKLGNEKAAALQTEAQTGNRRLVAVAIPSLAVELPKAA